MASCIYLGDIMPIWTDTSTTSGNSIQVIHSLFVKKNKHIKFFIAFYYVVLISKECVDSAFELPH